MRFIADDPILELYRDLIEFAPLVSPVLLLGMLLTLSFVGRVGCLKTRRFRMSTALPTGLLVGIALGALTIFLLTRYCPRPTFYSMRSFLHIPIFALILDIPLFFLTIRLFEEARPEIAYECPVCSTSWTELKQ